MTFNRGDKVLIKKGDKFIEASIVKIVKPYHGKSYWSPDEVRYFCQMYPFNKTWSGNNLSVVYSEIDLINWSKQSSRVDKLKDLGI